MDSKPCDCYSLSPDDCKCIYFSGAFTVGHYSSTIKGVSATQLEPPIAVRNREDEGAMRAFSKSVGLGIVKFCSVHYGLGIEEPVETPPSHIPYTNL